MTSNTPLPPLPSQNESAEPPHKKRKWYKIWWVWVLIVIGVVIVLPKSGDSESTASLTESAESSAPKSPYGLAYPADQAEFIEIIKAARRDIENADTDLQESKILRDRDIALCRVLGDYKAELWVGRVVEIGTSGEDSATVEIEIASDVNVETWTSVFSDLFDNTNTLIPSDSQMYEELLKMSEGTDVVFSANFAEGNKFCLRQANLLTARYGTDPGFIAQFTYIKSQ